MALVVGNLLLNPLAQSFISDADAVAYLQVEAPASPTVAAWIIRNPDQREASLASASRWMAMVLHWCRRDLTTDELSVVGLVAARVAAETWGAALYGSSTSARVKKRVKAGSVEVEYADVAEAYAQARAGGNSWPWIDAMLNGLICDPHCGIGALVV